MKILVGVSVSEYIKSRTVATLISLAKKYPHLDFSIKQGCLVHKNRNDLAKEAISRDYTHLFFVDADMCFSPVVLDRLLERNKDIIGANYYRRNPNKESVVDFIEDGELTKCNSIGTGCALIKTEVFKKMSYPYFAFQDSDLEEEVGEDIYFCKKAQKLGYEVWVDTTMQIGHIGEYIYGD